MGAVDSATRKERKDAYRSIASDARIDLTDNRDIYLHDRWAAPDTNIFLARKGDADRNIVLQGNWLARAKEAVMMSEGFPPSQCVRP